MRAFAATLVFLASLGAPAFAAEHGLGVTADQVTGWVSASGLVRPEQFIRREREGLGEVVVGGDPRGSFVVTVTGDSSDVSRVTLFLNTGGRIDRKRAIATMGKVAAGIAGDLPPATAWVTEALPETPAPGRWVYQMLQETWQSWPAPGERVERRIGDALFVFDGVPPELYLVTILRAAEDRDAEQGRTGIEAADDLIHRGRYAAALDAVWPAAAQSDMEAQYRLGQMHHLGRGVPKDPSRAAEWYRKAAEREHPGAMVGLGTLYRRGLGLAKDLERARNLFRRAASRGSAAAMMMLVDLERSRAGKPADPAKVAQWCDGAARRGNLRGQICMAELLRAGQGVPRDPEQAYFWVAVAAAHAGPGLLAQQIAGARQVYARGLKEPQVAEADRRARSWLPEQTD